MFNKLHCVLLIALLLQLAFIVWTVADSSSSDKQEIPLIPLNRADIKQIVLEKKGQPALTINNMNGRWLLPNFKHVNVSATKVDALINQLLKLKTSWPIAQTKTAAKQFKLDNNNSLAKISLTNTKGEHVDLMLGLSPGFKSTYARIMSSNNIYLVTFDLMTLSVGSKNWSEQEKLRNDNDGGENDQPVKINH